jgi:hypothetical protein
MATYSKVHLSGSTGGQPILVAATSTAGTTIHTTGTSTSDLDEIWLYANNTSSSGVKLTIEYGGTTSPNNLIELTIAAETGLVLVIPGLLLSGDGTSGRAVKAFAGTTNVVNVTGYVNRIS